MKYENFIKDVFFQITYRKVQKKRFYHFIQINIDMKINDRIALDIIHTFQTKKNAIGLFGLVGSFKYNIWKKKQKYKHNLTHFFVGKFHIYAKLIFVGASPDNDIGLLLYYEDVVEHVIMTL